MASSYWPLGFGTSLILNALLIPSVLYILFSLSTAAYYRYWHPLAGYPGPALRAAFHFPDAWSKLKGTSYTDTKALHDEYGSVVRMAPDVLSYNSAQAWRDIYALSSDRTELGKDPAYYKRWPAVQILTANQQEHNRIRKLLAPGFSDSALLEQEPLLNTHFDLLISKLKKQTDGPMRGRVDMMAYYNFITFDIIGDLVLGESFGALEGERYHAWMRNFFEAIKLLGVIRLAAAYPAIGLLFSALQYMMPSFAAKRKAHLAFTKEKIDTRLSCDTDRKDIIAYILRHNSKTEHAPLSHREILGNSRVLLTAGSDTTATHLSGATWLLLTHPRALERAKLEVREAFKAPSEITLRSVSEERRLPFLNAVIQETLRFYPSIPATLPRITKPEGGLIDGRFVPGNISVGVHQWSAYHSESNFATPDEFHPERWLSEERPKIFKDDNPAALQPFTLGPRVCLGKSLAHFEIRSILARVLWHFDLKLEEESRNWIEQKEYTLWDKPPLWVTLEHRVS